MKRITTKNAPAAIGPYSQELSVETLYIVQVRSQLIRKRDFRQKAELKHRLNSPARM